MGHLMAEEPEFFLFGVSGDQNREKKRWILDFLTQVQINMPLVKVSQSQPTYEELAAEPQAEVSFSWRLQEAEGKLVNLQGGLLHIALCPHVVPLSVIQGEVGLDGQDRQTISHIKGESHHEGSWKASGEVYTHANTHTHVHNSHDRPNVILGFLCSSLSFLSDAM